MPKFTRKVVDKVKAINERFCLYEGPDSILCWLVFAAAAWLMVYVGTYTSPLAK